MGPYDVQVMPGEPIVVLTSHAEYRINDHLIDVIYTVHDVLEQQDDKVFLILDYSAHYKPEFQEILDSSAILAVGEQALLHHRSIQEVLVVTSNSLIRLATEGLRADSFGNVNVQIFELLDEALAYARS